MRNDTRRQYNALKAAMAAAYGVEDPSEKFAVDIPQETRLNDAVQESSAFLQRITIAGVTDTTGQALELSVNGLLAKRTNVTNKDRQPHKLGGPDGTKWAVALTEFDVGIDYLILDIWARYPDFLQRYMNMVFRAIALDRMTIGWYGETVADESDPQANPLGQDVNIGWLKRLATQNSGHYMTEGATAGQISIGNAAGNDYANLDVLVYDLYAGIPVERRTGNEVAIVGNALVANDMNKVLTDHAQTPSEKSLGITTLAKSYGGLTAIQVPRFPDTGAMVTDLRNLHLYYQQSATRRHTKDKPERNQVVDFISSNDAYAVGDTKAITAVNADNVVIKNA